MKIFLDTANSDAIKTWAQFIDGVTTNPTLLMKEGGSPQKHIEAIRALLPDGEISVEVTQTAPGDIYKQAKIIADLGPNILVKIPCHKDYYPIIKQLVHEGVKLNITLVFTLFQGLMMCKLGVHYISPFVGRLDDLDVDGSLLLHDLRHMIDTYGYEQTGILAASLRHVRHVHEAIAAGADVATLPVDLFAKALHSPLTDQGIALFNADWAKLGIKQFP